MAIAPKIIITIKDERAVPDFVLDGRKRFNKIIESKTGCDGDLVGIDLRGHEFFRADADYYVGDTLIKKHITITKSKAMKDKNPKQRVLAIVPARLHSTRLPEKLLLDLDGKSVLERTLDKIRQAVHRGYVTDIAVTSGEWLIEEEVYRINDHLQVEQMITFFKTPTASGEVGVDWTDEPRNGTERVARLFAGNPEVINVHEFDLVIIVQGEQPMLKSKWLADVQEPFFENESCQAASLYRFGIPLPIQGAYPLLLEGYDGYERLVDLSRRPQYKIPKSSSHTDEKDVRVPIHIGVYAYRVAALAEYISKPPSTRESTRSLEPLRWLDMGNQMYMRYTDDDPEYGVLYPANVDTQADLDWYKQYFDYIKK